VEQRVTQLPAPLTPQTAAVLRERIGRTVDGRPLAEVKEDLERLPESFHTTDRPAVAAVVDALGQAVKPEGTERLIMAGASNLTRASGDFRRITPVLEAIEEQVVLLKLLSEMSADSGEVAIRIGRETTDAGLAEASVVAAGYGPGRAVAHLGVLGPKRMDYPGSIAVVRAIALYLSRILAT
jgi:heat-inducible transcriptional repressor